VDEQLFAQDVTSSDTDTAALRRDDWDLDLDGLVNSVDLDDDGDGLPDEWEEAHGFDPLAATDSSADEDADGLTRLEESERNTNPGVDDTDSDGVLDGEDLFPTDGSEWADSDGDGVGDNADPDDDDDHVADSRDAFAFDPSEWTDTDEDGVGDNADEDDDNDGALDEDDAFPFDSDRSGMQVVGSVSVDQDWQSIALDDQYQHPVVITGPPTYHDPGAGVARVRGVAASSFDLRFEEWENPNGNHAAETVSFLVVEEGIFSKPDGSVWESGTFALSGSGPNSFSSQSFRTSFVGPPALFLTVQTADDPRAVTVRAKDVTGDGFKASLFEHDPLITDHGAEQIGYLAVYTPSGSSTLILDWVETAYDVEALELGSSFVPVGTTSVRLQKPNGAGEPMADMETVDTVWLSEELFAQVVSVSDAETVAPRRTDTGGAACGDGIQFGDEECDDGNNQDGDGCSSTCHVEVCPDGDGDGACDEDDNCPSVPNADGLDTDEDGIGDACDNCCYVPNAEGVPPGHVGTGGQTDDDQDGVGNRCDADFDNSGFVNVTDLLRFLSAYGNPVSGVDCPDPAGNPGGACAPYDLTESGSVINVSDLLAMLAPGLFGTPSSAHGCTPADDGLVHCPLP
jgi:cysteine-rich repeat protein